MVLLHVSVMYQNVNSWKKLPSSLSNGCSEVENNKLAILTDPDKANLLLVDVNEQFWLLCELLYPLVVLFSPGDESPNMQGSLFSIRLPYPKKEFEWSKAQI